MIFWVYVSVEGEFRSKTGWKVVEWFEERGKGFGGVIMTREGGQQQLVEANL
jgi:hypothetical protein